jgi:hypothetical protein
MQEETGFGKRLDSGRDVETDVAIEDDWQGSKKRGASDRISRSGRGFRSGLADGRCD